MNMLRSIFKMLYILTTTSNIEQILVKISITVKKNGYSYTDSSLVGLVKLPYFNFFNQSSTFCNVYLLLHLCILEWIVILVWYIYYLFIKSTFRCAICNRRCAHFTFRFLLLKKNQTYIFIQTCTHYFIKLSLFSTPLF